MQVLLILAMLMIALTADSAERSTLRRTPPVGVLVEGEKRSADLREATGKLFEGTNSLRTSEGRVALAGNPALMAAARAFAEFMARTDQYGHEADGSNPTSRATREGYDACIVAENIAYQFLSTGFSTDDLARTMLDGWMDSPGHRANLLAPDVTELGVAIARSARSGKYYGVQLFGRPRAQSVEFSVRNAVDVPLSYELGGETRSLPLRTTVRHLLCRPTRLVFHWPGNQPDTTVEAESKQIYEVVRGTAGAFRVNLAGPRP
ncbi:MAG: CAP domain-containing protein [Steroidobacteraceae bacterium]